MKFIKLNAKAFAPYITIAINKEIEKGVFEIENVKKWVNKKDVKKIIIVPNKIINIVS